MHFGRVVSVGLAAAVLAGSGHAVTAQQPPSTLPVIVVLRDDVPFAAFRGAYRPDERAAANPNAWGYQNRDVLGAIQDIENRHGFRAERAYSAALRGFSARLSRSQLTALQGDPFVAYIEPDGPMEIVGQGQGQGGGNGKGKPGGGGGSGGEVTPWGISRIFADGKPAVSSVRAYIIDTGIDETHADLNVVNSVNFAGGPNTDCHGHGTHVSGTVAAVDNTIDVVGVASGAPLVAVKVLGCGGSGTTSGVIAGVDWVTANAQLPAVANMSLGGGPSQALDSAVVSSAAQGIAYALAAGNSGANACNYSPARAGVADGVVTTAATDNRDREASWSNYGSCVDVWAPGVSILSTKKGGGTTTMSGTSMASPHTAGTAARYLALWPASSAATVEGGLKAALSATSKNSKDGRSIEIVNAGGY